MTQAISKTCRMSILAAGTAALMGAGLAGAQAQDAPDGWFKACTEQGNQEICNVQNIMVASSGQLLTGVSLIELKGENERKVFQVTVPSGRMIPPGIGMQIDGGQTQQLDYVLCVPDRCIAEAPLNDQLVNAFKGGQQVTFTSVNFQNQQTPIPLSLHRYTASLVRCLQGETKRLEIPVRCRSQATAACGS
jgi:invasion protein IalB